MFRVVIEAVGRDINEHRTLREVSEGLFANDKLVRSSADGTALKVYGPRADYIVEQIRLAIEDPAFEPFRDWAERKDDQFAMTFDDATRG